jgi:cysteine desulfurase
MKNIYLDHAATTPVDERVFEKMKPYFTEIFGNPSSMHIAGQKARKALYNARMEIADIFACSPEEIIFTSGGTESDNLAILGVASAMKHKGKHIITSAIEHPAVLKTCKMLEKDGFEITYIEVEENGIVDAAEVKAAMREDTILVSIMYANNEIGTIQPIAKIGRACKKRGVLFHTDACQAAGTFELNVDKLHLDLMTINGGKIYGPKGVGALYVRNGSSVRAIMGGGQQEKRLRPGTENVAGAIGLAESLKLVQAERENENTRLITLRDQLIDGVLETIPKTRLNGDRENRLPNNVNISFLDIEGESILLRMDMMGVAASSGSACSSGSLDPSHVILALGLSFEVAHGSIRFSLGHSTTKEDIDYVLEILPKIVSDLRAISPVNS